MLPILLLSLFLPMAPGAVINPQGPDGQPAVLSPHLPALFHLSAAGSVELTLVAQAPGHAGLFIETSAPGADLVLLAPDGKTLETIDAEQPGWFAVPFPIPQAGQYRLLVRTQPKDANSGLSFRAVFLPLASVNADSDTKAAAIFAGAHSLARSPHSASLHLAIEKFRQAAALWAVAGDREGQLLALAGEARAWLNLSEYQNALAALNRAQTLSARMPFFRAWLANLEAQVYLDRWDSEPAMRFAQEAVRLSSGLNDEWLSADALAGRAEAEYLTGDSAERADIEQALKQSSESEAIKASARALRCKAWMEEDEGHLTRAMELMRQAEEQFRRAGEPRNSVDAMSNLATTQGMDGDHYTAVVRHSSLMPVMRDSGKLSDYAFLLVNIANDYAELNRVPDAIAFYRQSIEDFRKIGLLSGESIGLSQLCVVATRAGRLQEATQDCLRSAEIAQQLNDPKRVAITILRLGTVERASGHTAQALASFQDADSISEKVRDSRTEAQALMEWGDTLEDLGNREEARRLFEKALPLSQAAEDAPEQLEARYRIARSEFRAGEDENAKRDLRIALDSIESLRRTVGDADLQASDFAQRRKCHQLYVDILMREHERNPASPSDVLALEISESARARTLLDSLKARDQDRPLHQGEDQSAERLKLQIAVEQAYDQRLKLLLEGNHKRELEENSATLTQAIDSLQRMEDIARDDAKALPPSGHPLSAQDILQASKTSPATLLEYALGADQSYLWVIHDGAINSYVLNAPQEEIEGLVGRWRKLAATHLPREGDGTERELQSIAAKLSCLLLSNYIGPQNEKLAIVADGELAAFPFAALPLNGCDAKPGPPVITAHQVVMIPSLSIFLTQPMRGAQTRFSKEVAIVANPVFDPGDSRVHVKPSDMRRGPQNIKDLPALPRLIGTGEEAKEIQQTVGPDKASVFSGFSASVETMLSPEMRNYRILHLATHGLADESTPGFSGLVLSLVSPDGRPVFGYLKTHDIANLDLHPELVVLSDCDSGTGSNLSGEGVTGLAYAFLHAGARQVASTLWDVDDEVTKELMVRFYKEMYTAGLDPADALRQSQILMMQSPHRSAPYYWAGFEIISIGN
jgi:CHAT domain-containing protein